MNLTLSLLVLARHLLAVPLNRNEPTEPGTTDGAAQHDRPEGEVLVELIPFDPAEQTLRCEVGVDRDTEELLLSSTPSTWFRLQRFFAEEGAAGLATQRRELVAIRRVDASAAAGIARELAALNPHLAVQADSNTGTILVSG